MKHFNCKIKGNVSSEECYKCFIQERPDKSVLSRVVCKQDNLVKQEVLSSKSSESIEQHGIIFNL